MKNDLTRAVRRLLLYLVPILILPLCVVGCDSSSEPTIIEQPPGLSDYEKSQMTEAEIEQELADRAAKAAAKGQ